MIFLVLPEEDFEIPDFSQPIKNPWTVVTVRPVQKNSSIDKGFIINDEVFNAYKLKYIKIDGDIEELPEEGEFDLEDIRQAAKAYQPSVLVGSTGRTEHRNLHENVAMLVAKATPHYGIQIDDNIPMIDTRWPVEEGWKKWEMRFFYDTTIENESEIVIQYVCNNDVCDDFKFKEETSKPNPPPVRPPVPPLDILSRDDEMASVEQDVPPAPYTGIWSEEDLSFLERVGRIKLKPYEKEFLIKEGYTVQQWEDSLKNKRCIFYLEGGPYFMVRTLATLCKKASDGQVDEAHHMPASDAIHPNMPGEKVYLHWLIGTSILMEKNDHLLTSSYGRLNESKLYRKLQRNLIESGQYRDAVNLDINDVRNNFGVKYDKGIQQMLRYLDLLESTGTVK